MDIDLVEAAKALALVNAEVYKKLNALVSDSVCSDNWPTEIYFDAPTLTYYIGFYIEVYNDDEIPDEETYFYKISNGKITEVHYHELNIEKYEDLSDYIPDIEDEMRGTK